MLLLFFTSSSLSSGAPIGLLLSLTQASTVPGEGAHRPTAFPYPQLRRQPVMALQGSSGLFLTLARAFWLRPDQRVGTGCE